MKLLHIIDSMDPRVGGPCQGIRNMTFNLNELCIDSEIVSLDSPSADFMATETLLIHAMGPSVTPWAYSGRLVPWLKNNIGRFDVVISHGLWLYSSYAAFKVYSRQKKISLRKGLKVPSLFIMPHGMVDPYFQLDPDRRLKSIRNYWYWKLIEGKVINGADGMFFTCVTELMLARETFTPYRPKLELNIGYGIEAPPPRTDSMMTKLWTAFPELKEVPYILFFSRIHQKKGLDLLVDAYNLILTNPAFKNQVIPKLVIAGPGIESDYGQKIFQKVNQYENLKSSVYFTGMMGGDLKWAVIYGCQAFALPSHQENFGIAVAEALACGKPVLISDQVNIWREIAFLRGGIVNSDNIRGTETMLYEWMNLTDHERVLMGQNAYRTYEKSFKIKPVVEKFADDLQTHLRLVSLRPANEGQLI